MATESMGTEMEAMETEAEAMETVVTEVNRVHFLLLFRTSMNTPTLSVLYSSGFSFSVELHCKSQSHPEFVEKQSRATIRLFR